MTIPQLTQITNDREVIDSREVIDRIALLEQYQFAADLEDQELPEEEAEELAALVDLELQCKSRAPDSWRTGTVLMTTDALREAWTTDPPVRRYRWLQVDFCGVTYELRVG